MDEERLQKLKERVKKIGKIAKDYVPEIAGAAIGATFGNAVVGAIIGTTAKKLFDSFMTARQKTSHLSPEMQQNIARFSDNTVVYYGKIKTKNKNKAKEKSSQFTTTSTYSPQEFTFTTYTSNYR